MKYNSLEPFIPSGEDFASSKEFFKELGFSIVWENGGYTGFENNGCKFILQDFHNKEFSENLMMKVTVDNLDKFWEKLSEKNLPERFLVKLNAPQNFPWGREVNLIDIAGVCWHFSEGK